MSELPNAVEHIHRFCIGTDTGSGRIKPWMDREETEAHRSNHRV